MDPDANLREQLEIAETIQAAYDNADMLPADYLGGDLFASSARLAELVIALNEWIRKGGFLPAAWSAK